MEKINNCRCGEQAAVHVYANGHVKVFCDNHKCPMGMDVFFPTAEKAISEWNKLNEPTWLSMDNPALEEHKDGRYVLLLVEFEYDTRFEHFGDHPSWKLTKPHLGKWDEHFSVFELGEPCDGYQLLGWMPIPQIDKAKGE